MMGLRANSTSASYRVAVVGLGKIGLPLAALYASRGCDVIGCDVDPCVVEEVNAGRSSLEEPGIQRLIEVGHNSGALRATVDTSAAVGESNVVVLIVPLLVDRSRRPDFAMVTAAVRQIATGLQPETLVLTETTMPVGSTRGRLLPLLESSGLKAGRDFHLAYSPERVSSGTILQDLAAYPKVIGGIDDGSSRSAADFYIHAVGCETLIVSSAESAELTKLVETTYRDVNIALANEYARFAAARGLDVIEAITAANTQPFSHVHTPGIGVGGHCIPVYPYFLMQDGRELVLPKTARDINDSMPEWCANLLEAELDGLAGRPILILGLAYRPDIAELAFTPTIPFVAALSRRRAKVFLHDPLFTDEEIALTGAEPVQLLGLPEVDAVIVQAWHKEYQRLDFAAFRGCRVVLDGRNRLSPGERDGIRYIGVGRG